MPPDFLTLTDRILAYQRLRGTPRKPGLVFLGGFASDMEGTKASYLAQQCASTDFSYLRFDYRGHGKSSGVFRDGTLGSWFDDTLLMFDEQTEGPQIVVGSSMGGWLGLKLALARPKRVHAFVGIAAAPDFTEELILPQLTPLQRKTLEEKGEITDPTAPPDHHAPITQKLLMEARQHLMLTGPINIACPVHLLQGLQDQEVPTTYALRIAEKIEHAQVRVTYLKNGDHRLSKDEDLTFLWQIIEGLT